MRKENAKHACVVNVCRSLTFAHKNYSPWTILTTSLLTFWALNVLVTLLSMQGQKALGFHQKYLNLCSEGEWRSYGFGTTSGWVINDRTFIFGWTNPLKSRLLNETFMPNNHNVPRCRQISEARHIWRFGGTASSMRVATSSTTTPLWRWTAKAQLFSSRPTSQSISPDRKVSLLSPNGSGLLMMLTVFVLLNVSMLFILAMFSLLAYYMHTLYFLKKNAKNNATLNIPNSRL